MTDTQAPERICVEFEDSGPHEKGAWLRVSKDDPTQIEGDYFHEDYVRVDIHNAVVAERNHANDVVDAAKEEIKRLKAKLKALEVHNG